ncbi:RNA polymerase sigma-70 factor [Parapedobacter deserti]|uniref:RNA polymerase sigma-70 factor n=1 Tax=Parapedobacter deserti TaxID=1912957 RepID=A0ABV7JFS2_9SPHI
MKKASVLTDLSDEGLVGLIKNDDRAAFVAIYDKYWEEMYTCAFHFLPHREVCEDVVHDVFLKLWKSRRKININSLRNFLYVAVKNTVLNKIRAQRKHVAIAEQEMLLLASEQADHELALKEIRGIFERSLDDLPDKCRQILILSRKEHLSNKEIAERLNISTKTVENQINIALKRIRWRMQDFLRLLIFYFLFG